jgi:hypothetical protein
MDKCSYKKIGSYLEEIELIKRISYSSKTKSVL